MITTLNTAMRTSVCRFVARLALLLTLVVGTLGTASAQTVTYFHNDIAGTPMLATDAAGAVVWKENYLPYGYRQVADPASGGNKLWFTGKAYDPETQLSYMGARYYMPLLGRFTGIDPVGIVPEQPHSFNRYAYANNNPYKYVDPDGKIADTVWDAFNIALGFQSLVSNLRAGNWSGAAVDGVGIGIDGLAAAMPMVPGGVGATIAAHRAANVAKGVDEVASAANYRSLFLKSRPDLPTGWQVHHSMPQRYEELMGASGVNIHDVQFLRGVSNDIHSKITAEWARFDKAAGGNPSAAQVADFAKQLDRKFGDGFKWPGF